MSNYARYIEADFNRPDHYPLDARPDPDLYAGIGEWSGRLILPSVNERADVMGALIEIHLAPAEHADLIGHVARLRWVSDPHTHARFWGQTRAVTFNSSSEKMAADGNILPERINRWDLVNPFESLSGSHPCDDIVVVLAGPVKVEPGIAGEPPIIYTPGEPIQVTGRHYALIRFLSPHPGDRERYTVSHFNRASRAFDGPREVVRVPTVVENIRGVRPSSNVGLERSPANRDGWYAYGALDPDGVFVVRALAPRALIRVDGDTQGVSSGVAERYLSSRSWRKSARKGEFTRARIVPDDPDAPAVKWREGDEALLIHLYGGIGGKKAEPPARLPLYWGHFAFGSARVTREPLTDELIFDIVYRQIYTQNPDGLTAGALHWTRYCGDRQFGWLGTRPIQDILLKLGCFTSPFESDSRQRSALTAVLESLEIMAARYRIADGRGGVTVSPAYNCVQDANQALYGAVRWLVAVLEDRVDGVEWRHRFPDDELRRTELLGLVEEIRGTLLPFGASRADWHWGTATLSSGISRSLLQNLSLALFTWRTMVPPIAARVLTRAFLKHGASAMVLRTYQVGGEDADIAPVIPSM